MNLLIKNFKTPTRLLFAFLFLQILLVPNAYATDVSINGSENLTLMNDIVFDYQSTPRSINFDIANPFLCTSPFNDPNAVTVLNVNSILEGNNVLSAAFDYSNNIFVVNTDGDIQCASNLGIHNDVLFGQGFEQSGNNIEIVLKDLLTGDILNSASNIELHDEQLYQYKYEIKNTSSIDISVDILENYLLNASPTFVRDEMEGWNCSVISGSVSSCGTSSGIGYVSLPNAIIGAFGQLDVVVTRRVRVDNAGSMIKLDLLAAALLKNNVIDSSLFNNIAFTSFGTTTITASELNIISQPSDSVSGMAISDIVVEMLDADGILDSNNNGIVTININQSSPIGGTLSGNVHVAAVNGVATLSGLSIDKAGTNYKLRVSSIGLAGAISTLFNITPDSATHLFVVNHPSDAVAQTPISPVVIQARDANDNIDTNYTGRVFANIKSGNGNLTGTTNPFAIAGVATFNNLSIDLAGTGYTIQFSSGSLSGAISDSFNITAAPSAANSGFGIRFDTIFPPTNTQPNYYQIAGVDIEVVAQIKDASGARVGAGVEVSFNMTNMDGAIAAPKTCMTGNNGECSITTTSTLVGTTTVKASVDDIDIENGLPGVGPMTVEWVAGEANAMVSNFGVSSVNSTVSAGDTVTMEAFITDQFGNPVQGEVVTFLLADTGGAVTPPSIQCNEGNGTDASGICTGTVTSASSGTTTTRASLTLKGLITNTDTYKQGKIITWEQ